MVAPNIAIMSLKRTISKKVKLLEKVYFQEVKKLLVSPEVIGAYQEVVLSRFNKIQADYFEKGSIGNEDPTAPDSNHSRILQEVKTQLQEGTQITPDGKIIITPLSDEFLGIATGGPTSASDTKPMRWIYYFLYTSFNTDLLWINAETHTRMKPVYGALYGGTGGRSGSKSSGSSSLGRFGSGYLLAIYPSEKKVVSDALKGQGLSYDSLKHPQSGKSGNPDIFKGISKEIDIQTLVMKPALRIAKKKFSKLSVK